MHPLLRHPRGLLTYLVLWALCAIAWAADLHVRSPSHWQAALLWAVPVSQWTALLMLFTYPLCRVQPLLSAHWPRALLVRATAIAVLALGASALSLAWNASSTLWSPMARWVPLDGVWVAGVTLALFVMATLAHDVQLALQAAKAARERESQAQGLARDMELQMLRLQINPHFLFNALNAISALTHLNPAQARDMTVQLAQFFRQTLALGAQASVSLAQELALAEHYLAIESLRLGDKLQIDIQAEGDAAQALLPPLCLQPLVENAIKHGIRAIDGPGLLQLRAHRQDQWLLIRLSNPIPSDAPTAPAGEGLGMGLRNVQLRLEKLYGARAHVHARRIGQEFVVDMGLPYTT